MSLPSQSSRNATRSSQVHYRRSRGTPLRRVASVGAVLFVLVLVWFTLIRPRASKLAEQDQPSQATNTNQADGAAPPLASNQPAPTRTGNEPTIISNSPARPLPGSGDRPDPERDIDRALGTSNAGARQTGGPASTDILASAAQQAQQNSQSTQTQTQTQTQTPQSPDRGAAPQGSRPSATAGIRLQLDTARRLIAENDRVGARALLSQTLINADTSPAERQMLRDELTVLNQRLVFSPVADPRDPMTETYQVQPGDSLSRIASKRELATHWKLIARVNQIADPTKIRLGQNLKLVRGPFHAIVDKSDHRVDIYHGSPAEPASWIYIRSFDVGLGTDDGTPVGEFVVSENKLENPGWVNPRDARQQYAPNDPDNPIGEFWIGLTGVGKYSGLTSYGIHGTIDPDSIGGDRSMGCVRLASGDIDIVYELLAEHISRVLIVP